jgi:iron uptake system component EfeO
VFTSLEPILRKRAPSLAISITNGFADMSEGMEQFRRGTGWVTYTKVDAVDRRGLSRAVDALAVPLSNMAAIVAQ